MSGRQASQPQWPDATAAALAAHLRAHARSFLEAGDDPAPDVRLVRAEWRARSSLYRFDVPLSIGSRTLLVKIATGAPGTKDGSPAAPADRPRIAPFTERRTHVDLEYRALSRIQDHFQRLNDPRFGAVRVFNRLADHDGFVMEAIDQPTLQGLVLRGGPSRRSPDADRQSFFHAGAWLRAYHGLAPSGDEVDLQVRRADVVRFTEELAEYLASHTGHRAFFNWITGAFAQLARTHLPAVLPLALCHGDYAMRNILVGANERVTVLDTLACYRTCTYRDVGYFLADLRCSVLPALARGRLRYGWRLAAYRDSFFAGYFGGQRVPRESVALYEVQTMLERWASIVVESSTGAARAGRLRRASLPLVSEALRRMVGRAVRGLGAAREGSTWLR